MKKITGKLAAPAIAAILWAILTFTQSEVLLKTSDLSLFLFDWTFLKESFMIPGGFLGWAGSFFTQFLYIPWLGALLWVAMLYAAGHLTVRAFGIPSKLKALAALPVAALVIANMSLGYGMFIMRPQDYFFAPTLGYLLILGIISAVRKAPLFWKKTAIIAVSAAAGFIVSGVFALAGTLAAGICVLTEADNDCAEMNNGKKTGIAILSLAFCIAAPVLLYGCFTRYRLADSWSMGLPSISDDEWTVRIRLSYWFMLGLSLLFAALMPTLKKAVAAKSDKVRFANVAISIIAVLSVATFWYKDANFKAELKMSLAVDRSDWEEVNDIYRQVSTKHLNREKKALEKRKAAISVTDTPEQAQFVVKEYEKCFFQPTRLMVMFRDLALLKQNKALDTAFTMRDGAKEQKSLTQIPMAFQAGRQLYMHYGLVNMAYRWCLEDQVEHGWSYGTLRYMAAYATLLNETEFAAKYLGKLDRTLFHRNWSRKQRPLSADIQKMSQELPYREIIPYMSFSDRMSNDLVKCETYIMKHFAEDRDAVASPEFDRAALLWAMRTQNINLFWKALSQYLSTASDINLPKHVQEAVILYSNLEKEDLGIPIDKSVKDSYAVFNEYFQHARFSCEAEMPASVWFKFGNTYYYYYYFIRGLQTF